MKNVFPFRFISRKGALSSFHAVNRISKSQFWGGRWIYRFSKNLILDFVWKHIFMRIIWKRWCFWKSRFFFVRSYAFISQRCILFPKWLGRKIKTIFLGKYTFVCNSHTSTLGKAYIDLYIFGGNVCFSLFHSFILSSMGKVYTPMWVDFGSFIGVWCSEINNSLDLF